jgi:hypothetical protein
VAADGHVRAKTGWYSGALPHQTNPDMEDKGFQIASRLRMLSAELRGLERDLKSGSISDAAALHDFRQAIDEIRMTAWTVGELHNAQPGRKELMASFLAAERIRRFAQMMRDLTLDLEHEQVTWETGGIQTLFDSVTLLQSRLDQLIREHRANFRNLKDEQR